MGFSDISKNLRAEANLSQIELAKKLGISKACISMIEIGKNEPTAKTLIAYADFFGCSIDYLCGREDDFGVIKKAAEVPALSREETELLTYFKKLNNLQQQKVIGYCYALCH